MGNMGHKELDTTELLSNNSNVLPTVNILSLFSSRYARH